MKLTNNTGKVITFTDVRTAKQWGLPSGGSADFVKPHIIARFKKLGATEKTEVKRVRKEKNNWDDISTD